MLNNCKDKGRVAPSVYQMVFDVFTILAIVSPALLFMTMSASSSHGVLPMFMITSFAPASFAYTGIKAAG